LNGNYVGDEQVTKHFQNTKKEQYYTKSTLSKGSCGSAGWKYKEKWSIDTHYDGVTAGTWVNAVNGQWD